MKIQERIAKHYRAGIAYCELERLVFPRDDYPKAWNYSVNGGLPACRRVLKTALARYGYTASGMFPATQKVYKIGPTK